MKCSPSNRAVHLRCRVVRQERVKQVRLSAPPSPDSPLRQRSLRREKRGQCLVAEFAAVMATNIATRRLLTRFEAADALGLSVRGIDRLRERGRLPGIQILPGGRIRYRPEDVEALLEPETRAEPYPARADKLECH
jgi:excisionase family DNA binding protein